MSTLQAPLASMAQGYQLAYGGQIDFSVEDPKHEGLVKTFIPNYAKYLETFKGLFQKALEAEDQGWKEALLEEARRMCDQYKRVRLRKAERAASRGDQNAAYNHKDAANEAVDTLKQLIIGAKKTVLTEEVRVMLADLSITPDLEEEDNQNAGKEKVYVHQYYEHYKDMY